MKTNPHSIKFLSHNKSRPLNILILILTLLVGWAILEISLRIFDYPQKITFGWKGQGYPNPNQMGFRGQSIRYTPDDYVIVLLGDSQVEADACSLDSMPERRLEYYLNQSENIKQRIKVFSIGAAGYGQDQQWLVMNKYFERYRADLVLLWFTPINDVWNNIFPTHWPKNGYPKPTFRLQDHQLIGPHAEFGKAAFKEPLKTIELVHRALIKFGLKDRPRAFNDDFWEKYLPSPYQPLFEYHDPACEDWQQALIDGHFEGENLNNEKSHVAIQLTPASERMQYGVELTNKLLFKIKQLAATHDAGFKIFYVIEPPDTGLCQQPLTTHILNGKFYKTSKAQLIKNMDSITNGFTTYPISISLSQWKVDKYNHHLNKFANDQVMFDLSKSLMDFIPK